MPASLKRLQASGSFVLLHVCEVCGADAPFGFGVHFRLVLGKLAAGDIAAAKRHLGKWYCREHRPDRDGEPSA